MGETKPPDGAFTSVASGGWHACGVKQDGFVACWGQDFYGQATPPKGKFTSVSPGEHHTCGVRADGAIVCWGDQARNVTQEDFPAPPGG